MTKFLRYISVLCTVALAVLMTACSDSADMPEEPEDCQGLYLVCNIGMVGVTRANPVPDNEAFYTLRMIIVDSQGAVESNKYFDLGSAREYHQFTTKMKPDTRKRVYLFANEESVENISSDNSLYPLSGTLHSLLESIQEGDKTFENRINAIHYVPDFSKNIPLTSVYDIDIPEGASHIEKDFWLVRVATKFSIIFENHRQYDDVRVDRFEFSTVADRHFLMPRFTGGTAPVFSGYPLWIDWLKDVSDKSQTDPENPSSDTSGWLTGYDIPSSARQIVRTDSKSFTLSKLTNGKPGQYYVPDFYAPESKRLRSFGSQIANEQQYVLTIVCNNGTKTFMVALPNLRALFRNTHVLINIGFTEGDFNIDPKIDVIPFSEVILKPSFGLERDDITGYVIVRDPVTGEIKYWLDSKGDKWWLFEDGETHFVFAYEEPSLDNLDHWFDYKGVRHELTPKGITGLDPHYNTTTGELEFYENKTGHKYWLVEGQWFTVDQYEFLEHGPNPSGNMMGWYDFTGTFHSPSESKDTALAKWKEILGGLDPSD